MSAPLSLPGLTQFLSRLEDYPPAAGGRGPGQADHRPVRSVRRPPGLSGRRPPPVHRPSPDPGVPRRRRGPASGGRPQRLHRGGGAGSPRPGLPFFTPGPPPASGSTSAWKFWPGSTGGTARCWWPPWRACSSGPCPLRSSPPAAASSMWARSVSRRGSPTFWSGRGTPGATRWRGQGSSPCGGHSGRLLPRPGPAGSDGILGG